MMDTKASRDSAQTAINSVVGKTAIDRVNMFAAAAAAPALAALMRDTASIAGLGAAVKVKTSLNMPREVPGLAALTGTSHSLFAELGRDRVKMFAAAATTPALIALMRDTAGIAGLGAAVKVKTSLNMPREVPGLAALTATSHSLLADAARDLFGAAALPRSLAPLMRDTAGIAGLGAAVKVKRSLNMPRGLPGLAAFTGTSHSLFAELGRDRVNMFAAAATTPALAAMMSGDHPAFAALGTNLAGVSGSVIAGFAQMQFASGRLGMFDVPPLRDMLDPASWPAAQAPTSLHRQAEISDAEVLFKEAERLGVRWDDPVLRFVVAPVLITWVTLKGYEQTLLQPEVAAPILEVLDFAGRGFTLWCLVDWLLRRLDR